MRFHGRRRGLDRRTLLHQRQHWPSQRSHALPSGPVPPRLNIAPFYNTGDTGVELHTIPLFHANAWGRAHTPVMNGLKQVMIRRFDPAHVLRTIQDEQATSMALVPTMAGALLNCPDLTRFDFSSMKLIVVGGAASSPELIFRLEQAFKCEVHAGYGLTETGPAITTARRRNNVTYADDRDRARRQSMVGWPLNGTEIRVVDTNGHEVPRDAKTIGEVVVRGDTVMDGYYKDPAGTAAIMSRLWLHTGDMAVWDEARYVQIVDRKKDIIISGGENISSIEIENAIAAHPAVLECAVVAAPDPTWGEVPAAIVVVRPQQTLSQEELIHFLEKRLARFKLPHIIEIR
ncbi:MAG: AMP-binding protein, partial [Acidobacteriaceae bacterium]|nr:AMP-binding protein [Acidobacteriaceae bacterium]